MARKKKELSPRELEIRAMKDNLKAKKVRTKFILAKIKAELVDGKVIKGLKPSSTHKTIYKQVLLGSSKAHARFNFLFKCFYLGYDAS